MTGYLNDNVRGKHGQIVYDLEGDFGIDREELYERFAAYMQYFDIPRELAPLK